MAEAVLFADTVDLVCQVLATNGLTRSKVPNPRPATFTRVRRTGGPRRDQVTDDAQITVESWADDEPAAHDLAQLNRRALQAARGTVVDGVQIYTVREATGPGVLPDPESDQPRYTQTFMVATRGA